MSLSIEEEDAGLKDLVSRTLSENGALGKIQAQLRASVFLALEDEFREKDVPLCNPRTKELLQTPGGSLAASLVHDFFTCLGLDFSLAVYGPESNLGAKLWDLHTRECLLKSLGLGRDDEPTTPLLLQLCTRRPVTSASGAVPQQGKPLLDTIRKSTPASSTTNKSPKPGASEMKTINTPPKISQAVNKSTIPDSVTAKSPETQANSSSPPSKNVAKISNNPTAKETRRPNASTSTTSNQPQNVIPTKSNENNSTNDTRASTESSRDSSSSQKNPSTKSNTTQRIQPPDDILSAAPPDTDSSEASLSVSDVAGLLQETRAKMRKADEEDSEEIEEALSNGDYKDDFSEASSENTVTYDEESSTSSWGHPPPPPAGAGAAARKTNVNPKKDASKTKDSPSEPEAAIEVKESDSLKSTAFRRKSLDLLDDDVSIGEFISSEESSSAREETEDIACSTKQDSALDYEEKL